MDRTIDGNNGWQGLSAAGNARHKSARDEHIYGPMIIGSYDMKTSIKYYRPNSAVRENWFSATRLRWITGSLRALGVAFLLPFVAHSQGTLVIRDVTLVDMVSKSPKTATTVIVE